MKILLYIDMQRGTTRCNEMQRGATRRDIGYQEKTQHLKLDIY